MNGMIFRVLLPFFVSQNLRPAADLVEDASQYPRNYARLQMQVDNLEKQLEESVHMTQSLVKDQQSMMNLLYCSMSGECHQWTSPKELFV